MRWRSYRARRYGATMGRKKKAPSQDAPDDVPAAIHKAFRRMAFLFANLVCAIWLVLLAAMTAVGEHPPEGAVLAVLVVIGAPIAYAIPYTLVRLIGWVVVAVRTRPER